MLRSEVRRDAEKIADRSRAGKRDLNKTVIFFG
jgi:hypothetical protein